MTIYREEPNYDDSPWYKIMEKRAFVWENFALQNNLVSQGNYNAYHVVFKLKSQNNKIIINGNRTLSSPGAFHEGVFVERLQILIKKTLRERRSYIRINKSKVLNIFRKKHRNYTKHKGFFVSYNDENILLKLKYLNIFEIKELKSVTIKKKKIKLVLLELPENSNQINDFLKFCEELK
ncbi:MAG: hypothetical protein ACPGVD_10630 [Flavobacteriales bacterium]